MLSGHKIIINALAADEFIGCLLSLLKQSNFSRLDAFGGVDENGVNHSFELLNDMLTLALALGITIADVVLIPIEVFSTLKRYAVNIPFLVALKIRVFSLL